MAEIQANHGNFQGRGEAVLAVTIVMAVLCTVFVSFRMLSRGAIVKKILWDDYFMLLAWALAIGLSVAICYGCAYGLGRHEVDVPPSWQSGLRKSNYAFSVLYQPALMATKTSILAFYLTFSKGNYIFRWGCYATLFLVNAGGLALTLVTVFQCTPVNAVFMVNTLTNARCTDILTIYLSSIPLNIITDLTLLFLPMPILTGMRLPRKQKIILLVTFSFGIFVAVVDVVRISYLQSAAMTRLAEIQASSSSGSARLAEETDSSFYLAFSFMWSAIEVTVGIMCACVPALKPLVARFLPNMLRDPGDAPSHSGSLSLPNAELEKPAPPVHDDIQCVHHRDFGRAPQREDEEPMGMMDFLTGRPRDFGYPANGQGEMGMMDFLTTPDMAELPLERSPTALTNTTRHTRPESSHFFDFVNMTQPKSLVHMTNRDSIYPIAVVTVLFFIWGFEYGLLDTLNQQFQQVANVTTAQALGIRSAYYVGYFVGPLVLGRLVLNNWGFRACFPVGLSIYAAGCLIFWPAAVLTSWPTFLVTNFIVGFGLSNLEVSANPFIALCGPAENAEVRLNLSQGVQAIGSVIAPLVANKAFYHRSQHATSLVNTQWAYLGIALATVVLALVYHYVPLPEATDAELEDAAERLDGAHKSRIANIPVTSIVLALGVFSQFCYVGGQEVIGTSFTSYTAILAPSLDPINYFAVAHTTFAVSRFLAAGLGLWVKPRILLLGFYIGLIVFSALCTRAVGGIGIIIMVFFCEGPLFSLIFGQTLRGQGRNTKTASVLITATIGGGAVFSPISAMLATGQMGVPGSLVVAVAAFAGGTVFAVGLSGHPSIRALVDPLRGGAIGSRPSSSQEGLGVLKKRKGENGAVEWRERKSGE